MSFFILHIKKKKGRNNYITQLRELKLHPVGFLKSLFPNLSSRAIGGRLNPKQHITEATPPLCSRMGVCTINQQTGLL